MFPRYAEWPEVADAVIDAEHRCPSVLWYLCLIMRQFCAKYC